MKKYYWDEYFDYLLNTRNLYFNDNYLGFIENNVWKNNSLVNIVDFGCCYIICKGIIIYLGCFDENNIVIF